MAAQVRRTRWDTAAGGFALTSLAASRCMAYNVKGTVGGRKVGEELFSDASGGNVLVRPKEEAKPV